MNVTPHQLNDIDELRRRVRKETNAKQRDRYRVVLLALEGKMEPDIRRMLHRSRGFIQRWVYAYRDQGIAGLFPQSPPGKPSKLTNTQREQLKASLEGQTDLRRGIDFRQRIQDFFGVPYSLSGAFHVLHELGYEPLRPRPVNPKKDSEAEEAWKQAAPLLSRPSESNTPIGKSKCGSRTNAGLGRRDA
jgi:transposase